MKSKKGLVFTIVAAVVVVVAVVVLALVLWPKKSNKEVFTDAIKESFNISKAIKTTDGKEIKDVLADHIVKFTFDAEFGENSIYSEIVGGKDEFYGLVKAVSEGEKFDADALLKDKKLYFNIKDVLKKYYYVDAENLNFDVSKSDVDSDKISKYLVDSLLDVIENDRVKKDSDELNINGSTYKTDKYSFVFTGADLHKVLENFVKKVKEDKEVLSQIEKVIESMGANQKVNLDEVFDSLLKESAALKELGNLLTYSVHLYKGDVISTNITISIDSGSMKVPVSLVINNIEKEGKTYAQFYVSTMGQKMINAVINQTSDTTTDLSVSVMGSDYITGKITKTDKKLTAKISGTESLPLDLVLDIDADIVDDLNMNGTMKLTIDGETVNVNFKSEEVKKMPEVDVSNSAPYEEMSDEEKEALENMFGSVTPKKYLELDKDFDEDFSWE